MNGVYLNNLDIATRFRDKDVILFGAGNLGSFFWSRFYGILNVVCYIDNGNAVGKTLHHTSIEPFSELHHVRKLEPIIITSREYSEEMSYQLNAEGYRRGEDYFIWINDCYDWPFDDYIVEFIEHNKRVWSRNKKKTRNKILIPFMDYHYIEQITWSYAANYLSEKYNAEIVCYIPLGGRGMFKSLQAVYESYNVVDYIFPAFTPYQIEMLDKLTDEIYPQLTSRQSWNEIKVYDINFGKEICETYLRAYDPYLDISDISLREFLRGMLAHIVWWHDFFEKEHDIKAILWGDDVYTGGIVRKFAMKKNIPAYTGVFSMWRWEFEKSYNYEHYKRFFNLLSDDEKKDGIAWAQRHLQNRVNGSLEDIPFCIKSGFSEKKSKRLLKESNRIKVLICPHYFCDEPYPCGWQIFSDPYEWLLYLGELSNKTPYDWYLKMHPMSGVKDRKMIMDYLEAYPNITLLPEELSPHQLKDEGLDYALTIHGSIAHEYPLLGIQVINAGNNPHIAFEFCHNPRTIDEYEEIMMNLEDNKKDITVDEIYQFYCVHMLYLRKREELICDAFFNDIRKCIRRLEMFNRDWSLNNRKDMRYTEIYKDFLDDWSPERHLEIKKRIDEIFEHMDTYKVGEFVKRKDAEYLVTQ